VADHEEENPDFGELNFEPTEEFTPLESPSALPLESFEPIAEGEFTAEGDTLNELAGEGFAEIGEPGLEPTIEQAAAPVEPEMVEAAEPLGLDEFAEPVAEVESLAGEPAELAEVAEAAEVAEVGEAVAAEEAEAIEGAEAEPLEKKRKKRNPAMMPAFEWMGLVLVGVGIYYVLALVSPHALMDAIYVILMAAIPLTLLQTRKKWREPKASSPYLMVLSLTLVALLTGTYCLGLEVSAYNWDLKASTAPHVDLTPAAAPPAAAPLQAPVAPIAPAPGKAAAAPGVPVAPGPAPVSGKVAPPAAAPAAPGKGQNPRAAGNRPS
jgi:hypothetical protein